MNKFHKKNLENIQNIFEEKTGVNIQNGMDYVNWAKKRTIMTSVMIVSVLAVSFLVCYGLKGAKGAEGEICKENFEEEVSTALSDVTGENTREVEKGIKNYYGNLAYENWVWPTESEKISAVFGVGRNGVFSDHINIRGERSDAVYAVENGCILETGYKSSLGYYIVLELEDGITVKYGHLDKISVEEGDKVEAGDTIGEVGATGMATGPNLHFAVYVDEIAVNPLQE